MKVTCDRGETPNFSKHVPPEGLVTKMSHPVVKTELGRITTEDSLPANVG